MKLAKRNNQYIVSQPNLSAVDELLLSSGGSLDIEIKIIDKRELSDQQRRFIFKLCSEVADNSGIDKELFRAQSMAQNTIQNEVAKSSLQDYSMKDGNMLIKIIINYFIDNDIPLPKKILDDNDYRFDYMQTYNFALKKRCIVCGRYGEIHHVQSVGMGRDRKTISHLGMEVLPLCRNHHSEAHTIGNKAFMERYHLEPITVDEKLEYLIKRGTLKHWKNQE